VAALYYPSTTTTNSATLSASTLYGNFRLVINLIATTGNNVWCYIETTKSLLRNLPSPTAFPPAPPPLILQHWWTVVLATLWTGLVTVAYTIYAQSYGQSRIPATTVNLIYTIQPFFTAFIAWKVLNETTLGVYGYVGGSLIGAAVLVVLLVEDDNNNNDGDDDDDENETKP
jgi:drug/metabolite transporter (DMT)-like permease